MSSSEILELEEDFLSFRELEEFAAIVLLEELDFVTELLLDPIASLQDDEGAELLLDFALL